MRTLGRKGLNTPLTSIIFSESLESDMSLESSLTTFIGCSHLKDLQNNEYCFSLNSITCLVQGLYFFIGP